MAYTKIHAVKATVHKAVNYICNPDKTDESILISSFGCSPETASYDFKFALSKTRQSDENKAFHLIQSFLPGRPHCLRRVGYRSGCDWTGVPLFSLWVMAKSGAARYFESVFDRSPPFIAILLVGRSWRTAAHAYAHHNHKEEVFGE